MVTMGEDSDSDADETGNKFYDLSVKRSLTANALTVQSKMPPKTVPVTIENFTVHVLPDSGSEANVIPVNCLPKSLIPTMTVTKTVLQPYKSEPIYPKGKVYTLTCWGNRQYRTKWYVVESGTLGNNMPLLSRKVSEELGIIVIYTTPPEVRKGESVNKVNCAKVSDSEEATINLGHQEACNQEAGDPDGPLNIPENAQALKNKYKHLFTGVGKLNNRKVRLYPKAGIKPRIAPYRPIPAHLQKKVDEELRLMLEMDRTC